MTWNMEQAANDLERYVLIGTRPAVDAVKLAVELMRGKYKPCDSCENNGPMNWCEECMFSHANCYTQKENEE